MNLASGKHTKTILIISALDFWSMGKGKGGPALWQTLTGYTEHGWKVIFVSSAIKRNMLHEGIKVIAVRVPVPDKLLHVPKVGYFFRLGWLALFSLIAIVKSALIARNEKPDVFYGYETQGVLPAWVLSRLFHRPVVSRYQGTPWKLNWLRKRFNHIRALGDVLAYKIPADLIIMTNDGTQGDRVLQELGVDMGRVKFWVNGVDKERFTKTSKQEARIDLKINASYILLAVSRLVNWKHVDRSVRALADVIKEFPDVELIIVGDGPERKPLQRLAEDLGISKHVRFEGGIPHEQIPKYLAAADIFLSFYDWSNVGNPLLEAMAAGKCIVTLNVGDTGRFVINGDNGILIEPNNLHEIPHVIVELLRNNALRLRLGQTAREFAQRNLWTWDERISAELTEIEKIIDKRHQNKEKMVGRKSSG